MSPTDRIKQLLLPIRRSRVVRTLYVSLQRNAHRRSGGNARGARTIERALSFGAFSADDRTRSVLRLNEMFFELSEQRSIDIFIEAGAKEAAASQRAAGFGCQSVAFEANPYTHKRFAAALADTPVDYRHQALSDHPGSVTFMVRLTAYGTPIADGQGSLLVRPDHEPGYEQVSVEATTLDHHVESMQMPEARIAMWVDVEGALAEVLGGASTALERTDILMVEVETKPTWNEQRWLVSDVIEAMAASGLVPAGRDVQSRHQHNIVFLRSSILDDDAVSATLGEFRRWELAPSAV